MKRYLCPIHKEDTPSVILYDDRAWCFGCSRQIPLDMLGVSVDVTLDRGDKYVEDIQASLKRISALPKKEIRGFSLPYDVRGYYIVWPDNTYYKCRTYDMGSRYIGPMGHQKPIFKFEHFSRDLIIVEGEINAMSLNAMQLGVDIISPGGAGDFYSKSARYWVNNLKAYDKIYVIVDNDAAGAKAGIQVKAAILASGNPRVFLHLDEIDANDRYTSDKEEAKRYYKKTLGL
jgi:hypothetical protein